MKTITAIVFIFVTLVKDVVLATDYCRKDLCDTNESHVGCNAKQTFGSACGNERSLVPMTADLRAYFLKKHNQARSDITNGKVSGYVTASRMVEMAWDDELAKLAEYNAISCNYGHDDCRNTDSFQYAGQNIAMVMSSPNYFETIKAIDYLFGKWFDEYKDCNMTYINKYRDSDNPSKQIGHFTQIVAAGASRVGCAMVTFDNKTKNVYIVCNYSLTNILDRPIYTTGKPCSGCTQGCSATWPGLCNPSEVIPLK